jgi:hypothetical protein
MVRPHLALGYHLGRVGLRVELAHVAFPNGRIASTGAALGLTFDDALTFLSSPDGAHEREDLRFEPGLDARISIVANGYLPWPAARLRTGSPHTRTVGLLGARLDRYVAGDWFVPLEAHGALTGGVGGYMDVFSGIGWSPHLTRRLRFEALAQVGAGGGGNVHTGGGILVKASVGASLRLTRELEIAIEAGPLIAPDGEFSAWHAGLRVGLASRAARLASDGHTSVGEPLSTEIDRWRVYGAYKSYFPLASARRRGGAPMQRWVQLVGAGLDRPVNDWLVLTGRGYSAFAGEVGGYSEGLLGARAELPLASGAHHLTAQLQVGAGAGGGVDVGSGAIGCAAMGWRFRPLPQVSTSLEAGYVQGLEGSFRAVTLELGVHWHFDRLVSDAGAT